ncbi:Uncharacterised protein [uncultured Blautia sp.]|nr:Uncharacterised protein [uncultured Blautia sp.]
MQHDAAHQLHPVGPHTQHPVRGLPHGGKSLRQDIVQGLAILQALLELCGGGAMEKGPLIHIIYKRWGSPHEKAEIAYHNRRWNAKKKQLL